MKKEIKLFDKPENVRRLLYCFYVTLLILLGTEFFIHKHVNFYWEESFAFFAIYGFVSCVVLIFVAKLLRMVVMRKENYYDR